jgi:integrase
MPAEADTAEIVPDVQDDDGKHYRAHALHFRDRAGGPHLFRNPALEEWKLVVPQRPASWPQTEWSRAEVLLQLDGLPTESKHYRSCRRRRLVAVRAMLDWLGGQPGSSWQQRWVAGGADDAGRDWVNLAAAGLPADKTAEANRWLCTFGIRQLFLLQVVRPGYRWIFSHQLSSVLPPVRATFDPGGFAGLAAHCQATGRTSARDQALAFQQLSRILLHVGGALDGITVADCLAADTAMRARKGCCPGLYYDLLLETGILPAGSPPNLRAAKRRPLTVEELVDTYQIRCVPIRDLLVDYLRERQGSLDYSSLRSLVNQLVRNFWWDLEQHHPGLDSLHLTPQTAAGWKRRLQQIQHDPRRAGQARLDPASSMMAVRAFYSDIAQWALEDPARWGRWAAPNPIRPGDVAGHTKAKRRRTARIHQRTRELAPVLPRLVDTVQQRKQAAERLLAAALPAGHGQSFDVDGQQFTRDIAKVDHLRGAGAGSRRVYALDPATGKRRDLLYEEDDAFWAWAIVEILRHTGIRAEELLELTHHSFASYRLPTTGEIVPLLQIAPSKTDQERLLVVSPELAEVLTAVIFRVRGDREALPLVPRYDSHERTTSSPMPFLMQRQFGPNRRVISAGYLKVMIGRALAVSGLVDAGGRPLSYSPHDFRRIFATEAVAAGLPLPILAKLMGHNDITTTQGYAAIYPEDVITHHRAFIGRRRDMRPTGEYRQPSDAEWEEFLGHFERRKVELGVCGRAYGTPCQHEHACVRCPMLRPDPKQLPRLAEIVDNLKARLDEAHRQGWLGEVDGIRISLDGAERKLEEMRASQARRTHPVTLGMPTIATFQDHS